MSAVAKIAVPLLLVAAAGGAYFLLGQGGGTPAVPAPPQGEGPRVEAQDPTPRPVVQAQAPAEVQRTEVERRDVTDLGDAHSDAPQGVKGRVLLPNGDVAVGAKVLLLENAMNNPIDMFLKNKTGQIAPPLATAQTLEDGSFALGVRKAGQKVDLRIVTDAHPELSKSPISVRAEDWYDAGDLMLEVGITVQGRVLDAATKAPVAAATVFLSSSSSSHAMVVTPGRERGVSVTTDQGGYFRFTSAPRIGTINLTAEAAGYASTSELNKQISPDAANDFTLEIEAGSTITGVVVDPEGKRLPGAKVAAFGLSVKTPQNETVLTDQDGEFRFPALRPGPYRLTTSARNYSDDEMAVALTGEDHKVVLHPRATVRLKVLTAQQRPVKAYRLALKRAFPMNPDAIGNVIEFSDRNVSPRDYEGDWAVIRNMPTGDFKFQITEKNHAKSLSPMFKVAQGADEAVEVVVELTEGAVITGQVVDDAGRPVAGARVASDMNAGLAAGTGLFDIFRKMIPEKHTAQQVTTDKEGFFRLTKLAFADYMIRVSHPQFCEGTAVDIKLTEEGQVVDAGVIALQMGARLTGVTTVGGAPAGQVKVVISMPTPTANELGALKEGAEMTAAQKEATARRLFSTHVLSDGNGNYTMLKRVPPGTYKITAARHSAENPFGALIDMKETERELIVAPGQDTVTVNFNLTAR